MSYYTNDIDTLRQLVSQSIPTLIRSAIIVVTLLAIMLSFSVWLTLVLLLGVALMLLVTRKIGGGSAKYFGKLQKWNYYINKSHSRILCGNVLL